MTRRRRKNPFQFLTKKFPKRMQKKLVMLFVANAGVSQEGLLDGEYED